MSDPCPYVLHHGDALDVLRTLPEASVDAVVTDPPYFLPATPYSVRSGGLRSLSDLSILEYFFRDVFAAVRRVLRPTGFAYFFCDGQSYPVFYAVGYRHFRALRPLIWDKQVSINGYAWRHQHELILFCESSEAPHVKTGDGDVFRQRAVPIADRQHLAEKPVDLLRRLIDKTTPTGGLILDPFAGSGSTGVAALQGGYRFIGIEHELEYVTIATARLDGAPRCLGGGPQRQLPLSLPTEGAG